MVCTHWERTEWLTLAFRRRSELESVTFSLLWFCVQEVSRIDKQQALIALGRFKSCVRTSLLLCGGYECQEKEGTFMIAFPQPKTAVEWALTLQLALLRWATPKSELKQA